METKNREMVIYLLQLFIECKGKKYHLKYIGQTINYENRKKQHIRDLKNALSSKSMSIYCFINKETREEKEDGEISDGWRRYNAKDVKPAHEAVINSIEKGLYSFDIIHRAKTKAELNCAELAYMYMLEPQMNSYYSEASCYNRDCPICQEYALWGRPNMPEWRPKWQFPSNRFFTPQAENERRKYLRTKIKQDPSQIAYYRKNKAGWLINNRLDLFEKVKEIK